MAHFAELDENDIVIGVLVVENKNIVDETGKEQEQIGIAYLRNLFGQEKRYVQTSYNHNFRKKYAGIGDTYRSDLDMFIEIRPYPSWTLSNIGTWEPPISKPDEIKPYSWDEDNQRWFNDPGPQPFPSWIINEETGVWEAPIPIPDDFETVFYDWDEENQAWIQVE